MATTHKPGDTVPRNGTVEHTQYPGTRDQVKASATLAPSDQWRDHDRTGCTWQFV